MNHSVRYLLSLFALSIVPLRPIQVVSTIQHFSLMNNIPGRQHRVFAHLVKNIHVASSFGFYNEAATDNCTQTFVWISMVFINSPPWSDAKLGCTLVSDADRGGWTHG